MRREFVAAAAARVSPARAQPPPLADYEAWFGQAAVFAPARNKRFTAIDARALRRIVVMRRDGYTFADIGRSISRTADGVRYAYLLLPEELR